MFLNRARSVCSLALLLSILIFCASPSHAQSGQETLYGLTQTGGANNPLTLLRQRLSTSVANGVLSPQEGPVDPETYIVGPGDQFSISVAGQELTGAPVPVGADGQVSLPGSDVVMVADLTLQRAREAMLSTLRKSFVNAQVAVSLVEARSYYVHVTGAVPTPGRYLALPVSRVSSILEVAFSDTTRPPIANPPLRPSFRNIRVIGRDGSEKQVDLLRYFSAGRLESNPMVSDGDVIYVPSFDPRLSSIFVGGSVPFPGLYDYRPGDSVRDIIDLAGGTRVDLDSAMVRIQRYRNGRRTSDSIPLDEIMDPNSDRRAVGPLDQVSVAPTYTMRGSVTLAGELVHPGTYPIIEGETTLGELVEAAGGITNRALIRGAYLERASLPPADVPRSDPFSSSGFDLENVLAPDTTELMMRLRLTDMDFLSRVYYTQETRIQRRASIDLESIIEGTTENVLVRDGDRLVIPADDNSVFVIGQVNQPGFIALKDDQGSDYYLEQAGGLGELAGSIYVLHPATGAVSEPGSRPIQSGDVIFVDRSTDIADNAELQRLVLEESRFRRDARIRTTQAISQGISTIATVIALIVTLRRN